MPPRRHTAQSPKSSALPRQVAADGYNEAQLRAILDTCVEGIITIDAGGIIESFNPSAERLFGYRAEEVIGKNVALLMPSPDRERHDAYVKHYLETGQQRIIGVGREVMGRRKDGTLFPVHLSVSEVRDDDRSGGCRRRIFTGYLHDLTQRHEYETQLRQERDFAESLIETAHAIVLVLDPQGRIVRYNQFLEEVSGYPLSETVGKDWFETFLPKSHWERIQRVFMRSLRGDGAKGFVSPIVTASGVLREISWWDTQLRDADGNVVGVLAIGHDVTDLRQAQMKLIQSERLAALGEAMAGLAHESRNALQRIQVAAELLLDYLGDDCKATEFVRVIVRAQHSMQRLLQEVKEYAAPIQLAYQRVRLDGVVQRAWNDLIAEREGRQAEFIEDVSCADLQLDADPYALAQVFRNIFENSLAACEDPVEIRIMYSVEQIDGREALQVRLRDNGPGLSPEARGRAFDSFFTTKTKGTGLGLAISKRIVEAHEGQIAADPNCPSGAEFAVTLPRRKL